MNKYTVLLMAFLGVSIILQGVQAQSCRLSYEDVGNNPGLGSAARGFELDSTTPTLTEDACALNFIDFDGDCDCTLTVYSKNSFTGCSASQAVASTSHERVQVVGGLWKRSAGPLSFTVTCQFPLEDEEHEEEIGRTEEEEQIDDEHEEEIGRTEEEQQIGDDLPWDFRALTPEEAADPLAAYVLSTAPSLGLANSNIPEYHLTGTNTLKIGVDSWTQKNVYLVTSDLSGNNGKQAKLLTVMGTFMNQDPGTGGVYLAYFDVIYLN